MRNSKQQKWQLTLFCSLTIAYTSLLIGILRFSLDLAKIIFMNAALNTETLTKLIINICMHNVVRRIGCPLPEEREQRIYL